MPSRTLLVLYKYTPIVDYCSTFPHPGMACPRVTFFSLRDHLHLGDEPLQGLGGSLSLLVCWILEVQINVHARVWLLKEANAFSSGCWMDLTLLLANSTGTTGDIFCCAGVITSHISSLIFLPLFIFLFHYCCLSKLSLSDNSPIFKLLYLHIGGHRSKET